MEDLLCEDIPVERVLPERLDYFEVFSHTEFRRRYHLKKAIVLDLLTRLAPTLEP